MMGPPTHIEENTNGWLVLLSRDSYVPIVGKRNMSYLTINRDVIGQRMVFDDALDSRPASKALVFVYSPNL
jgi:hypothetical protein